MGLSSVVSWLVSGLHWHWILCWRCHKTNYAILPTCCCASKRLCQKCVRYCSCWSVSFLCILSSAFGFPLIRDIKLCGLWFPINMNKNTSNKEWNLKSLKHTSLYEQIPCCQQQVVSCFCGILDSGDGGAGISNAMRSILPCSDSPLSHPAPSLWVRLHWWAM